VFGLVAILRPGMTGFDALTFGEAAGRLGISSRQLADLVVEGKLRVVPVGDVRLIPLPEVQRLVERRNRTQEGSQATGPRC